MKTSHLDIYTLLYYIHKLIGGNKHMEEKSTGVLSTVLKVLAIVCALAAAVAVALVIVKKFCKKKACACSDEEIALDDCYCDCDCIDDAECICCDEAECPVEDADAVEVTE